MSAPTSPPASRRTKSRSIECKILLLDDNILSINIPVKSTGQVLFDEVIKKLQVLEADYFDLQYTDLRNTQCWLDHDKPILRQLPRHNLDFQFLVKFYTPDPGLLEEHYTRYLFALQLRKDLITGTLPCQEHTAVLLASYIVQAELGDFTEALVVPNYLKEIRLLPDQTEELEQKIADHHRDHIGQSPAVAEFNLLDTARKVDLYGIQMHSAKDHEGVPLHLAVAHLGVLVFQNQTKINTFSWAKIRKLSFKRKKFLVKLHSEGYGYYKDIVEFFFESRNDCKNFWKKCVEHHAFFRCQSVKRLPRNRTRLVSRGSSFRYCGRTMKQLADYVREHSNKRPEFQRSTSMRTISVSHSVAATPKVGTLKSRDHHLSHPNIRSSNSSHALCLERALAREKLKQSGHCSGGGEVASPDSSQSSQTFKSRGGMSHDVELQTSSDAAKGDADGPKVFKKSPADLKNGTMDDFNCLYFKHGTDNIGHHDNISQDSYQLAGSRDSLDVNQVEAVAGDETVTSEVKLENGMPEKKQVSQNGTKCSDGVEENVPVTVEDRVQVEQKPSLMQDLVAAESKGNDLSNTDSNVESNTTVNDSDNCIGISPESLPELVVEAALDVSSEKRKRLSRGGHIHDSTSSYHEALPVQVTGDNVTPGHEISNVRDNSGSIPAFENSDNEPNIAAVVDKVLGIPGHSEEDLKVSPASVDYETKNLGSIEQDTVRQDAETCEKDQMSVDNKQNLSVQCTVDTKPPLNRILDPATTVCADDNTVCLSKRVVATIDAEYPYVLHRRQFVSKGEQTDNKVLNCPVLNLRSRSLSPGKRPSKTQQRAELEKVKAMLSQMSSQIERPSAGPQRILDFVKYSSLPPRDSFSSKDDSVNPTVTEIALTAKRETNKQRRRSQSENSRNLSVLLPRDSDFKTCLSEHSSGDEPLPSANLIPETSSGTVTVNGATTRIQLHPVETSSSKNTSPETEDTVAEVNGHSNQNNQYLELNDLPPPPSLQGSLSSLENFLMNINLPPPFIESEKVTLATLSERCDTDRLAEKSPSEEIRELLNPPLPLDIDELLNDKCLQVELYIHESPTPGLLSRSVTAQAQPGIHLANDSSEIRYSILMSEEFPVDEMIFRPIRLSEEQFESVVLSPPPPPIQWRDEFELVSESSEHGFQQTSSERHSSDLKQDDVSNDFSQISHSALTGTNHIVTKDESLPVLLPKISPLAQQIAENVENAPDLKVPLLLSPSIRTSDFPATAGVCDERLLNFPESSAHGYISDEDDVELPYSEICLHDIRQELELEARSKPFLVPLSSDTSLPDDGACSLLTDSCHSVADSDPVCSSQFSVNPLLKTNPKIISDPENNTENESVTCLPMPEAATAATGLDDATLPPQVSKS